MATKATTGKKKAGKGKKKVDQGPTQPTLKGHAGLVAAIDFYNETLFTASWDRSCKSWDLKTHEEKLSFEGHTGNAVAVQLVNGILWTASLDKSVRSWDTKSGACKDIVRLPSAVVCMDFTATNLIAACDDVVYSIDLKSKEVALVFQGHSGLVSCLKVMGERLFTGSWDNTVRVWELSTGKCVSTLSGHKDYITCIALQSHVLFSGSLDKTVVAWDILAGTAVRSVTCADVPQCIATDGTVVLVGLQNATTVMMDSRTLETSHTFIGHTDAVRCIRLVEGGRFFTGSKDKTVKLWDTKDSTTVIEGEGGSEKDAAAKDDKGKGKGKGKAGELPKGKKPTDKPK